MRLFVFLILFFTFSLIFASSITINSDAKTIAAGERFTLEIVVNEDSNEEIKDVIEPDFAGFSVESRGESSSSSFNIINGKVSFKKEKRYSYVLRAEKEGAFEIGPAALKLESGKVIRSNKISIIVSGSNFQNKSKNQDSTSEENLSNEENSSSKDINAPLNNWEKRNDSLFIRTIAEPSGEVYKGEPVVVSYYLFARTNLQDVNFYKLPTFEKAWSEEIESPKRLNFFRTTIEGVPYSYALLKKYLVIPDSSAISINATQMIMDFVLGSFFNTKKKTVSSIALSIPLKELPEKAEHPNGIFGNFTITADKNAIELTQDKQLDFITYSVEGCGNFHDLEIKMPEIKGLKIFPPDIKNDFNPGENGICGKKIFKFMIKGTENGTFELPEITIDSYSREKLWQKSSAKPISVKVLNITSEENNSNNQSKNYSFEFLNELPKNVKEYDIRPFTEKLFVRVLILLPVFSLFFSLFLWFAREIIRKRKDKFSYKKELWEKKIKTSDSASALLNNFYDALSNCYGLELKGLSTNDIEKKFGKKIEEIAAFIKELQYALYSNQSTLNLDANIKKAIELFKKTGGQK